MMTILHMFNQNALVRPNLVFISEVDSLLLCGDAVYAMRELSGCSQQLYALEEDVQARGLAAPGQVHLLDYAGFVALCVEHDKVVSW